MAILTLFDYRPKDWYHPAYRRKSLEPPDRRDAPDEVLKWLRELADYSLQLDVPQETKESVLQARRQIDGILAERGGTGLKQDRSD